MESLPFISYIMLVCASYNVQVVPSAPQTGATWLSVAYSNDKSVLPEETKAP